MSINTVRIHCRDVFVIERRITIELDPIVVDSEVSCTGIRDTV